MENFGGVVVSGGGRFLLREPTDHFGGLTWTFAKTRSEPGEAPEVTALRAVWQKTGYDARVRQRLPGAFHGDGGVSSFFLMEASPSRGLPNWQTAGIRWETFDNAVCLIRQSQNEVARQRDLTLLETARAAFAEIPREQHFTVHPVDWVELLPMPARHAALHPMLSFSAAQMEAIRRGFVSYDMDDRWFIYFDGTRLRLHRSWTGVMIFDLNFAFDVHGNATVTEVLVNRDPAQYQSCDDHEDIQLLRNIVEIHLLRPCGRE